MHPAIDLGIDILAFTGTRKGMTAAQRKAVTRLLEDCNATTLLHGDCLGADAQAHAIADIQGYYIVAHPSDIPGTQANCKAHKTMTPRPALERNRRMVDKAQALIATPAQAEEQQRGGTWSTIRYARRLGRPIIIVLPSGALRTEDARELVNG